MQNKKINEVMFYWEIPFLPAIKNGVFALCIVLFILIIQGCSKDSIPVEPVVDDSFAIYFLKDSTLKIKDIYNKDINSLWLADKPWITANDFYMYDFSSHCMYLKGSKKVFLLNNDTMYNPPPSWTDKPFIVTVNKIPCYAGYIINPFIYSKWFFSTINSNIGFYPDDVIYIGWNWLFSDDVRNNDSVKKVLQAKGLYHGGINIEFDSISVFNGDTASIRYSILIKNNDNDNIYILDPAKCGDSVFNVYHSSPVFFNTDTRKVYYPDYFKIYNPLWYFYNWKPEWFSLLGPGEIINRKVFLKAYNRFADGNYIFQMDFNSPHFISKEKRYNGNGRYWIGKSSSDVFSFKYSNNSNEFKAVKSVDPLMFNYFQHMEMNNQLQNSNINRKMILCK